MKKLNLVGSVALAAFASISMSANASITSDVIITFGTGSDLDAAVYGQANMTPTDGSGTCPTSNVTACFNQAGATVGTLYDGSNSGAHLHRTGPTSNRTLQYHADSAGYYIRAQDGTAFSATSLDFRAPFNDSNDPLNPDIGPDQYWEILGFNTAYDATLWSGDGTNYATRVAYQQVLNGTNVNGLALNSDFQNVSGIWIHYVGYPKTPTDGKDFAMVIDNIHLGAAVSAVPIPAAAWLFGSAIAGFLAIGRRKAA